MATKDSRTKAFSTTSAKKSTKAKKGSRNKRTRHNIVISIFVVIALILVVFAALIIGKIIDNSKNPSPSPSPTPNSNVEYIPRDAGNVKMGNLLLINDNFKYTLPEDLSDMVNIYQYQRAESNKNLVQFNGSLTYSLYNIQVTLEQNTLSAFNAMVLDYCKSINSASNLQIAWGGYSNETRGEYETDVNEYGKDYYDHALGTAVTLKINSPSTVITESILRNQFSWIYENAHKYGFIIRVPDECRDHTSFDSSKRVHLRYVGIEHATYIFNNNICLEEYLELIRTRHTFDNPLVINSADGKTYNVYYVEYAGNPTSIPVIKASNYSISGDNMNGFIVTVEK